MSLRLGVEGIKDQEFVTATGRGTLLGRKGKGTLLSGGGKIIVSGGSRTSTSSGKEI